MATERILVLEMGIYAMTPASGNPTPWSVANNKINTSGFMLDTYGQYFPQPEVDFWQQYWATGFNAPGLILPLLPAYAGATGPAVPLMIKDPLMLEGSFFYFGTQGVEINSSFVGINGDMGPRSGKVCK
jgi:hypothetical protein